MNKEKAEDIFNKIKDIYEEKFSTPEEKTEAETLEYEPINDEFEVDFENSGINSEEFDLMLEFEVSNLQEEIDYKGENLLTDIIDYFNGTTERTFGDFLLTKEISIEESLQESHESSFVLNNEPEADDIKKDEEPEPHNEEEQAMFFNNHEFENSMGLMEQVDNNSANSFDALFEMQKSGKTLSPQQKEIILKSSMKDEKKVAMLTFLNDKNPKNSIKLHYQKERKQILEQQAAKREAKNESLKGKGQKAANFIEKVTRLSVD